jgi:hypothetical protein
MKEHLAITLNHRALKNFKPNSSKNMTKLLCTTDTFNSQTLQKIFKKSVDTLNLLTFDGRFSVEVGILTYYAKGRGFDSRPVQTFVCMNMSVCIGSGCFYV